MGERDRGKRESLEGLFLCFLRAHLLMVPVPQIILCYDLRSDFALRGNRSKPNSKVACVACRLHRCTWKKKCLLVLEIVQVHDLWYYNSYRVLENILERGYCWDRYLSEGLRWKWFGGCSGPIE